MSQFIKSMRRGTLHGTAIALLSIGLLAAGCARKDNDPPERQPNIKLKEDPNSNAEAKQPEVVPGKGKIEQPVGLVVNTPKALQGYTLIAPMASTSTYLIDMEGKVVRTWESDCFPAWNAILLENGNLLRAGTLPSSELPFQGPGVGGRIQEFNWKGELIWDYKYANAKRVPHHHITRMPNGNVLMIVWERKSAKEALAAGQRASSHQEEHVLVDCIIEVKPTGKTTGEVVWEWHAWDHIIQDSDKSKANYGDVSAHPELLDVNFSDNIFVPKTASTEDIQKLKGIGYLGGPLTPGAVATPKGPDWLHINSVNYNAELDQIVLSSHIFSEIWVIDHGTTTAEAASHTGGRRGKGGDLLYRWGNPRAYRQGTTADRRLFGQHDAQWIAKGFPGEGNILIFNNGSSRPDGSYSSVDEIVPPLDASDSSGYKRPSGSGFGPERPAWSFTTPKKSDFFSMLFSGAQRLPNGNTLICAGTDGTLFEVTAEKEIVWKYVNPIRGDATVLQHGGPPPPGFGKSKGSDGPPDFGKSKGPDGPPDFGKSKGPDGPPDFGKSKGPDGPPSSGGPKGPGGPPGQILPAGLRDVLNLTPEQRKQVDDLQQEIDKKLAMILTEAQRMQFKEIGVMRPKSGPPGGPGGPGGPPNGFPKLGDKINCVFMSQRYAANFPGLAGKDLQPGKPLEAFKAK